VVVRQTKKNGSSYSWRGHPLYIYNEGTIKETLFDLLLIQCLEGLKGGIALAENQIPFRKEVIAETFERPLVLTRRDKNEISENLNR
jgi:hypothetical protein